MTAKDRTPWFDRALLVLFIVSILFAWADGAFLRDRIITVETCGGVAAAIYENGERIDILRNTYNLSISNDSTTTDTEAPCQLSANGSSNDASKTCARP